MGVPDLSELTFLLQSGSDRIGALDFQASATEYVPRLAAQAALDELVAAATLIEKGMPLTPLLDQALNHGTSIGGARPKALIDDNDKKIIAKFSASNDTYSASQKLRGLAAGATTWGAPCPAFGQGAGGARHSHVSQHGLPSSQFKPDWLCTFP